MAEFVSPDQEGKMLHEQYEEFVSAIRRNIDPKSNSVLLVDDERGIRMKVARDVKKFAPNMVIHEAANGKEALDKLEFIRKKYFKDPLLIVLDLNMPIMDGWEVIQNLKEDYENKGRQAGIPIVVLSSTSGEKGRMPFHKQSVHEGKSGYTPLVSVAKETCTERKHYDETGEEGLMQWLGYFVKK